ncbi:hypothetical protein PAMP_022643 [Pampus punctatissimus]
MGPSQRESVSALCRKSLLWTVLILWLSTFVDGTWKTGLYKSYSAGTQLGRDQTASHTSVYQKSTHCSADSQLTQPPPPPPPCTSSLSEVQCVRVCVARRPFLLDTSRWLSGLPASAPCVTYGQSGSEDTWESATVPQRQREVSRFEETREELKDFVHLLSGLYRTVVRPSYKIVYRTVTSLEWKCCPGFSGAACEEGELTVAQMKTA